MKAKERPVKILKFQGDITAHGDVIHLETYKEKEVELLDPYDSRYTDPEDPVETKATRREEATFRKLRILEQNLQVNNIGYSMENGLFSVTKKYDSGFQTRYVSVENGVFCFGHIRKVTYSDKSIRHFMEKFLQWFNN